MRAGFRRVPVNSQTQTKARPHTFAPAIRGLVTVENITAPNPAGAAKLENFFPTQTGLAVRRGCTLSATIGLIGIPYDGGSGSAFTVGDTVTGGTSGATADIVEITGNATSGVLYVNSITGEFDDNEAITDESAGVAVANIPSGVTARLPVRSIIPYKFGSTEKLFAANATRIYDITTPADEELSPTAIITGQTSGEYSIVPFETIGAGYIYLLNGDNSPLLYNGTNFQSVTSVDTYALAYDAESAAFTAGQTLTGGTSGATATIVRVIDNGATGILHITTIASGPFQNNETITDGGGGSATADIPSGVTTLPKITGVTTTTLIQGCAYRSRLFFVEKNSMRAWYLPVESLGGAASSLNLSGVFTKGGKLVFVATWSLDAGDGLDDKIVFYSDQGEAAIYEGDFSSASEIRFVGRYDISPPLGKNATGSFGGELVVLTRTGIVPISAAINKDAGALALVSLTRNIEPDWQKLANARASVPWTLAKWTEKNRAYVCLPVADATQDAQLLVVNLITGAWTTYTGWDARCLGKYGENVYFGDGEGQIFLAENGGFDNGAAYTARVSGLAERLAGGFQVTARIARALFEYTTAFNYKVSVSANYSYAFPTAPSAASVTSAASLWDTAVWDTGIWDNGGDLTPLYRHEWVSVHSVGFALSWQVQVTSGNTVAPDVELQSIDLMYEVGLAVV